MEVAIALFVRDSFVRPYLGDTLAVILVYLALRATGRVAMWPAILIATALAAAIEFAQLLRLLSALGLEDHRLARIVLGSQFEPLDLVAYAAGALCVILAERLVDRRPVDGQRA